MALGEFIAGLGYGWLSPTLKTANIDYGNHIPSVEECAWIGSLHSFGRVLGPIPSLYLLDMVGRSALLVIFIFSTCFIWLLLFIKSTYVIYLARLLFGIACGMFEIANAVYLAENCSTPYRLLIGSFTSSFFYCGILCEFILATYFQYNVVLVCNIVIGVLSISSLKLLREPVQFLISQDKDEAALQNLMYLKAITTMEEAKVELKNVKLRVEEEKSTASSQKGRKLVLIAMILHALTPWTGYETLTAFASMTLYSYSLMSENQFVILLGLVQFLISCTTLRIVKTSRRRTFIIVSFVICAILHAITATLFYLEEHHKNIPDAAWFIFATVTFYMGVYSAVYPAIYILRGELFPINLKARGGCVCIMANGCMEFLTTSTYLSIIKYVGNYFNFVLYSCFSVIIIFYVYFLIPETSGKSKGKKKNDKIILVVKDITAEDSTASNE